ncbi:NUDIX hydrolase [Microlunatus sp. Y2014]|uniref:NUDIX hydrolase n=1 Tax=Microlunatus sp. Y2014 TaxID=3418488 RepID=UPI003DA6ED99
MNDLNRLQRKVTAFITRPTSTGVEVAICWHAGGGHQLPAGTVEDGEPFEAAVLREAAEETGLVGLAIASELGAVEITLPEPRGVLLDPVRLRHVPGGPETSWALTHVAVRVLETRDAWALIRYVETDVEDPEGPEIARLTGWVPAVSVGRRQERRFFHLHSNDEQTEPWQLEAEPGMMFRVAWYPLASRPALVAGQEEWFVRFGHTLS